MWCQRLKMLWSTVRNICKDRCARGSKRAWRMLNGIGSLHGMRIFFGADDHHRMQRKHYIHAYSHHWPVLYSMQILSDQVERELVLSFGASVVNIGE